MRNLGKIDAVSEGTGNGGGLLIIVSSDEFQALCELAAVVEEEDGWHLSKGHVEKWSGKEVDLTKALELILNFARNWDLLDGVIEDLQKFRDKWTRPAIEEKLEAE